MVKKTSTSAPEPQPVPAKLMCSLCGEDWGLHGANPTVLDCIRVLKAFRQPKSTYVYYPTPIYPTPSYTPWTWYTTTGGSLTSAAGALTTYTSNLSGNITTNSGTMNAITIPKEIDDEK